MLQFRAFWSPGLHPSTRDGQTQDWFVAWKPGKKDAVPRAGLEPRALGGAGRGRTGAGKMKAFENARGLGQVHLVS